MPGTLKKGTKADISKTIARRLLQEGRSLLFTTFSIKVLCDKLLIKVPGRKGKEMLQRRKIFGKGFLLIAALGTLFLLAEMIFQSFGSSICQTEGCRVVSRHTRFGDISIILVGLSTFSILTLLSFLTLYRNKTALEKYINLVIVVSLAAEGYFTGYQVFGIHAACVICLITFGIFLALGVLRLLYGETDVLAGFLSLAGVFALFYLILPAERIVPLPQEELILFYSKDCKYCAAVMQEIEANKMRIAHVPVDQYSDLLAKVGIEHVPTLYVNRQNQKMFLTGKQEIDRYLFGEKKTGAVTEGPSQPQSFFNAKPEGGITFTPPGQSTDQGVCKETEKCE